MADLTKEQFDSLPDFVKGDYEQAGEVYRPKAEGRAASLKASLDALDGKLKTTDAQLREILGKAEEDRTKAEQSALERLKKEGKIDEILADSERRNNETKKQYEERIAKLSGNIKAKEKSIAINDITAALGIFDDQKKLFARLIDSRIDVDPETGKRIYLDENGGATSLDDAGFIEDLSKDSSYDRMRQGDVNRGGVANGNSGNGGGAAKKFNEYSADELKAIRAKNPAEYDRLLKQYKCTEA